MAEPSTSEPTATKTMWYRMTPEEISKQLEVDPAKGLSSTEVQQRKAKYGANQLAGKKKESGVQAFLRQYQDFMQLVLVGAAVINYIVIRDLGSTLVLLGLTVFNAVLGLNQESKAKASLD